jgi:predicted PilT family ATPase
VSSVTVEERAEGDDGDDLRSVLVVVPDNQLSLAIGKKGQNARLAAKLTGMRIDIKSESELEAERTPRDAVPIEDRAALEMLPGVDAALAEVLVSAGLGSPGAIVRAGREKLGLVVEIGDRADAIYAAAEKLVTDHRAAQEAKAAHAAAPHTPPPGDPTPS